jgi:hypothetical protein
MLPPAPDFCRTKVYAQSMPDSLYGPVRRQWLGCLSSHLPWTLAGSKDFGANKSNQGGALILGVVFPGVRRPKPFVSLCDHFGDAC